MTTTLIIPGLQSSGPAHWQTWLQARIPNAARVEQADWNNPDLPAWSARIRHAVTRSTDRVVLVAHSFGALASVQAAYDLADKIAGVLLVAPADPEKFRVGRDLPAKPLAFPSIVVASSNDPWMAIDKAAHWSDIWGSDFIELGAAGHINAQSGFGPWPAGLALAERLRRASDASPALPELDGSRVGRLRYADRRPGRVPRPALPRRVAGDRDDIRHAAALLKNAGWRVDPPQAARPASRAL